MPQTDHLFLDEIALSKIAQEKKSIYILQWLLNLDRALDQLKVNDIKTIQKKVVEQLVKQISNRPGAPTRKLIGQCLANIFKIGDTFLLFDTVNSCNDILRNRDDSPSFLSIKLASIICIGAMYEQLGRLMGRSYEETVTLLLKLLKNAESQLRSEIFDTLRKIVVGMGTAACAIHRDIFKAIKHGLADRVLIVRCNAAFCLSEMISHASFLYTTDIENVFSLCFRALETSNYEVRRAVAKTLGRLIATTQKANGLALPAKAKLPTLDEALSLLSTGFCKGNLGGFLKSAPSEMIKGTHTVSKELRVGISYAYIEIIEQLGNAWFEKNMQVYVKHLLDLLVNPKAYSTHIDTIYSRRCVLFVLCSACKRLSEKAQLNSLKVFAVLLSKYKIEVSCDSTEVMIKENGCNELNLQQHVLVCILLQMGCIFEELGTCSSVLLDSNSKMVDNIVTLLTYPVVSVRIAASWCLRSICKAVPSQLTMLIDHCVDKLENHKSNPDIIHGYALALSAFLGAASQTSLGIPHSKGKIIFCIAEDLLRSASQSTRLCLQRTQAGWQLMGAVLSLGPSVVRGLLPRLLLIWKSSFPRNGKELESERTRGDAFTWQITLENRAGALSAMSAFLIFNQSLADEDTKQKLFLPIDSAILMLNTLSNTFKSLGAAVKAAASSVRLRLYETLLLLAPTLYENCFTNLLRILVAEFTLAENLANTTSSLLKSYCHADDQILLGSWTQETDQRFIEDQLQPSNASALGALENDVSLLYKPTENSDLIPSALPLGVSVINQACLVFAHVFRVVAFKHRMQMLTHFLECIKHAKVARQEAIQINILTTLIGALKSLGEHKAPLGNEEIRKSMLSILMPMLPHSNPLIRCASAQALGRLGQVVGDGRFVAELTFICFEKCKSARDMLSRTGHSITIGYLQRYVGSLGTQQNLSSAISILLALSQDSTSPVVQVWSLHALGLIVDSGGPMFRAYIDVTLQQALKILCNAPALHCDVHQYAGRLLSALITTIGPELQDDCDEIVETRNSLLIAAQVMQSHSDKLVQVQAIGCMQQLHMFAASAVSLQSLVPALCDVLQSEQLLLRSASISCLYQLCQREAREVCAQATIWLSKNITDYVHGLPGMLFTLLDREPEAHLRGNIQNILTNLWQHLCTDQLLLVIVLCKEVLTSMEVRSSSTKEGREDDEDDDDDEAGFHMDDETRNTRFPRWQTKVYAAQSLCRVITHCEQSTSIPHFNLAVARERTDAQHCLVQHLSDLIRMAFMAATSDSDPLRLAGLQLLELIIEKFAKVPEPEFPDHVILEQYQAQVGAALRPAFAADTASHVTAMACQVCSAWISSGVARDLNDLRRVHQLLVSSLHKLQKDSSSRLYNEYASTMEKLAILKAWAEVYVVATKKQRTRSDSRFSCITQQPYDSTPRLSEEERIELESQLSDNENLLQLVRPELQLLSKNWLDALHDHALLTLPSDYAHELPHDGGAFYTPDIVEIARPLYRKCWSPILHAASLWLCASGFEQLSKEECKRHFYALLGVSMEALCNPKQTASLSYVITCLYSLQTLLAHEFTQKIMSEDERLCIELCAVLHRLLITRESLQVHQLIIAIARLVCLAQSDRLAEEREKHQLRDLGEGCTGDIQPGDSLVYTLTEISLCVLVRQIPELSGPLAVTSGLSSTPIKRSQNLNDDHARLVGTAVRLLAELPWLCAPRASIVILPSVLYLLSGVLRESRRFTSMKETFSVSGFQHCKNSSKNRLLAHEKEPIKSLLVAFETIVTCPYTQHPASRQYWMQLLQSCLSSILDLRKSCDQEPKPDEITVLQLMTIFILKAPAQVLQAANLQYPCVNLLMHSLEDTNELIQLKTFEILKRIFQHNDSQVKIPYIHSLAPRSIQLVNNEIDLSLKENLTKTKYNMVMVGLELIEVLIENAQNKINLMMIFIPLLMKLISEKLDELKTRPFSVLLHNFALQKLVTMGTACPEEFRQVISQAPTLKLKLEQAIKNNQQNGHGIHNMENKKEFGKSGLDQNGSHSIKLKTNFSNFC